MKCQSGPCPKDATYRVSTRRGESIDLCFEHKNQLIGEMVAPIVTLL